ncbi:hypothetical protein [Radiobacillus sp. PE A8.2]|uniref:hypothetical protein n=1 Tax=Radiobacillus sp. PE A8.2 TaxID=3380349 RepID=UPI00389068F1
MRKFIVSTANWLPFIIISFLLIREVISLIEKQSMWIIVYVVILSISWLSFLLFIFVKPKDADEA